MFPDVFPLVWTPHPENPLYRGARYDQLRLANPDPNKLRNILWKIYPSMSKVPIAKEYWRNTYPRLSAENLEFWIDETGIKDEEERKRHFETVRDAAWQTVQEFTIARWWFLRNIMAESPYYHEVRDLARHGATIVDLGCGFGQDLRRLKADGATGELYGVDSRPELWDLGLKLFKESEGENLFRKIDIISSYGHEDPLAEFAEKGDIFLLNDVLSFWGSKNISATMESIHRVSKVGTKVFGWLVGQEGETTGKGGKEFGDGYRGAILTLTTFKNWFTYTDIVDSEIKWDLKAELVGFEELGFDEEDQKWFRSDFWDAPAPSERPDQLKAICFLATRTH